MKTDDRISVGSFGPLQCLWLRRDSLSNQISMVCRLLLICDACKPVPKGLVSISGITGSAKPIDGQSPDFVAEKLSDLSQEESF